MFLREVPHPDDADADRLIVVAPDMSRDIADRPTDLGDAVILGIVIVAVDLAPVGQDIVIAYARPPKLPMPAVNHLCRSPC